MTLFRKQQVWRMMTFQATITAVPSCHSKIILDWELDLMMADCLSVSFLLILVEDSGFDLLDPGQFSAVSIMTSTKPDHVL